MPTQSEAPPSHTESKAGVSEVNVTTDTRANHDTTEEIPSLKYTRPSLRELVVFGCLFVAYVAALTVIGVVRAVQWLFEHTRNHQTT
jgi:hypothetical protein